MKLNFKYFLFTLSLLTMFFGKSQVFELKITNENSLPLKKINYSGHHITKSNALKELDQVIKLFQNKGYLLAEADTISQSDHLLEVTIVPSQEFKWAYLKIGNLDPSLASRVGFSEKLFFSKPFNNRQVLQLKEKIINYYENNGYPFASVKLDSIAFEENILKATLRINKNDFFKIDSVIIVGSAKVNTKFLNKYINVIPGKPYNEQALKGARSRLSQLPFLTQSRQQEVRPSIKTTKLLLFLNKKNASQFDGIVGIQPNSVTGKAILTGDVKIKVVNGILHNGETFDMEWRRLQALTQDFRGKLIYPYMFGSPFGGDYQLKIYKRDTSFIDINNDFGLQYYFSGLNFIKLTLKERTSNIISTAGLSNATVLPDYADVSTQMNGFGVFYEKVDYRFNPKRGISIQINASAGDKKIRKNPNINDAAYRGIVLNSAQYMYDAVINGYVPLAKNSVLKLGLQSASIFGSAPVFKNELLRIGGLKTLRGFDEESIFTSFYVIPTIEYRYVFAQNSSIILFGEGAFYEMNSFDKYIHDTPLSIGTGINFETKAGILTVTYALGNQFGGGFDARSGKIHFGLTSLF